MFYRDFMEYHQDRFEDHSLMVYRSDELIGVIPANIKHGIAYSHQGLTYGGLVVSLKANFKDTLESYQAIIKYLNTRGIRFLKLKRIPRIYENLPSDAIDYCLFKSKAERDRCDLTMAIDLKSTAVEMSTNRKRNLKKAQAHNIKVREVFEFDSFFKQVLIPNLKERHQTSPTHTVAELDLLRSHFPDHIRQFNAYYEDEIIAGVTVFVTNRVAHAQYISTLDSLRHLGGLDMIFDHLIQTTFKEKWYFNFGISNENQGQQINEGLLHWKSSFGAHPIVHEFYTITTENYKLLNDVWI